MNTAQDWDVVWKWHWFRRAVWEPFFRDPAHPEGRPARTTAIWDAVLKAKGARRVLDCNCGLGLRALLLHEAGYSVVGTDSSGVAIEHARELALSSGADVTFEQCTWSELGDRYDGEFDAVINDAFPWTLARQDLRFAAHNFASCLKPGGVLIFTGADEWSTPEATRAALDYAWQAAPRFQLRTVHEHMGCHVSMVVARDYQEHGIVENYLFVVNDENGPRLETATIYNSTQWTWDDYKHVCHEAQFASLETMKLPVGNREHALNVATR